MTREQAITYLRSGGYSEEQIKTVEEAFSPQQEHSLITWLLDEIWDEDQWELNCGAFPEILCRKLVKLGYVVEKDGEYERFDR